MIKAWKTPLFIVMAVGLAACDENGEFMFASAPTTGGEEELITIETGAQVVERDVEAPEVFQTTEAALWDGRPSLGGVWVAHPDVTEPERVIIRNTANGNEVIGALFRRERENPGPRIQVSSDAAIELQMLAGQPAELAIVALKREQVEVVPAPVAAEAVAAEAAAEELAPGEISAEPLDDPIASAAAAIDAAEATASAAPAPAAAPAAAAPTAAPAASALSRPFVQIGIFSVEANANSTAAGLREEGVVPTVKRQESQGKVFWRVIVGPAASEQERESILAKVKGLGFADAYFVTN
jgi:cell division septation protein DedD